VDRFTKILVGIGSAVWGVHGILEAVKAWMAGKWKQKLSRVLKPK